jgi:hypothetical protein
MICKCAATLISVSLSQYLLVPVFQKVECIWYATEAFLTCIIVHLRGGAHPLRTNAYSCPCCRFRSLFPNLSRSLRFAFLRLAEKSRSTGHAFRRFHICHPCQCPKLKSPNRVQDCHIGGLPCLCAGSVPWDEAMGVTVAVLQFITFIYRGTRQLTFLD